MAIMAERVKMLEIITYLFPQMNGSRLYDIISSDCKHISPGFLHRVMTDAIGSTLSRIIVHVVERNPQLPEVPNHRVLMRFEPGYAVRADPRTHMLQTLARKWHFLVTLDEFLRPECHLKAKHVCIDNMDILLINIAADGLFI